MVLSVVPVYRRYPLCDNNNEFKCVACNDPCPRSLCQVPYYGHKLGCPNYGKCDRCPPRSPFLDEVFDLTGDFLAVCVAFNLEMQRDRMSRLHPDWSEKRCECVLYWQGGVKKLLKQECELELRKLGPEYGVAYTPEAMGVRMTETMANAGLELDWNWPLKIIYKIALIGKLKA